MDIKIIFIVLSAFYSTLPQHVECSPEDLLSLFLDSKKPIRILEPQTNRPNFEWACLDITLKSLPDEVETSVREELQLSLRQDRSYADTIWSLREELFRKGVEELLEKVAVDKTRLENRMQLATGDLYASLDKKSLFKFIKIMTTDIKQSVNNMKRVMEKTQPNSILERFLNSFDMAIPREINKCTAELIFKSDEGCIKDIKNRFNALEQELEKLAQAANFTIPNLTKKEHEATLCPKCFEIQVSFGDLVKEVKKSSVFTKFKELVLLMKLQMYLSPLIADRLSNMPYLNCSELLTKGPAPKVTVHEREPEFPVPGLYMTGYALGF